MQGRGITTAQEDLSVALPLIVINDTVMVAVDVVGAFILALPRSADPVILKHQVKLERRMEDEGEFVGDHAFGDAERKPVTV